MPNRLDKLAESIKTAKQQDTSSDVSTSVSNNISASVSNDISAADSTITIRINRQLKRHWQLRAFEEDTTLTELIIQSMTAKYGTP